MTALIHPCRRVDTAINTALSLLFVYCNARLVRIMKWILDEYRGLEIVGGKVERRIK